MQQFFQRSCHGKTAYIEHNERFAEEARLRERTRSIHLYKAFQNLRKRLPAFPFERSLSKVNGRRCNKTCTLAPLVLSIAVLCVKLFFNQTIPARGWSGHKYRWSSVWYGLTRPGIEPSLQALAAYIYSTVLLPKRFSGSEVLQIYSYLFNKPYFVLQQGYSSVLQQGFRGTLRFCKTCSGVP